VVDDLDRSELLQAAAWLRDHQRDETISSALAGLYARFGVTSIPELARRHPDETMELADALKELVDQIPDQDLISLQTLRPVNE
jgi:hypothetical protein